MKKMKFYLKVSMVSLAVISIAACQKDDVFNPSQPDEVMLKSAGKAKINTFNSLTVPVGNGIARAWVTENESGEPVSVGVTLSEKALENLPSEHADFVLPLPKGKGKIFYTHVLLNWNPQGHFPPNIYGLPHFDVHFYIISNDERMAITANDPAMTILPPAQYVPAFHLPPQGGEPMMGAHWVDLTSPEFQPGGRFSRTFIWGSFDGRFIFWEPMITLEYLQNLESEELISVPQPAAFQQDGYYPVNYKIERSASPGVIKISMDLAYREGN